MMSIDNFVVLDEKTTENEVEKWLKEVNLGRYARNFSDIGVTSLDDLKLLGSDDDIDSFVTNDLKVTINIDKLKFKHQIRKLQGSLIDVNAYFLDTNSQMYINSIARLRSDILKMDIKIKNKHKELSNLKFKLHNNIDGYFDSYINAIKIRQQQMKNIVNTGIANYKKVLDTQQKYNVKLKGNTENTRMDINKMIQRREDHIDVKIKSKYDILLSSYEHRMFGGINGVLSGMNIGFNSDVNDDVLLTQLKNLGNIDVANVGRKNDESKVDDGILFRFKAFNHCKVNNKYFQGSTSKGVLCFDNIYDDDGILKGKLERIDNNNDIKIEYDNIIDINAAKSFNIDVSITIPNIIDLKRYVIKFVLKSFNNLNDNQNISDIISLQINVVSQYTTQQESQIRTMITMGFNNRKKNIKALKRWSWDIEKAINCVVTN
mmetsp:Transcript_104117/g.127188  ORF Transcript_104117/g.127188 Transcript_104117/m.127188 type:complete len:432 (-) Transcript_104117:96-1391(-)